MKRTILAVMIALAATTLALAGCSSGDGAAAPTPDPLLAGQWEYAGYQVDGSDVSVFVRLFGLADVSATLDDSVQPFKVTGGDRVGIQTVLFSEIAPGRHSLRISDTGGTQHIRDVWVPPATVLDVAAEGRVKLKSGDGFRVKGTDLIVLFTGVFGDSRCPTDVVCVQAGDVTLIMSGYLPDKPVIETAFTVVAGTQGSGLISGYRVAVHDVTPTRTSGTQPDFSTYEVEVSYTHEPQPGQSH